MEVSPEQLVWRVDHVLQLRRLGDRRRQLEDELQPAILEAHLAGHSMAEIGRLLGMSRQSVWERVQRG